MPAMGIDPPPPNSLVSPYTSLDEPTAGSTERGTPNSFSSSSSQSPVRRLNSIVRDALLGSVTCTRPPVRCHTSHESTVPNASLPAFAFGARARNIAEQPLELRAGEIGVHHETGLAFDQWRQPAGLQLVAPGGRAAILPHDGVMQRLARLAVPHDGGF